MPVGGYLDLTAAASNAGFTGRLEGGYHFQTNGVVYGFAEAAYSGQLTYQAGIGARLTF